MFNVGDGDAMLVHLQRNNRSLVMVVDCGRTNDYRDHMRDPLQTLLANTGKQGPDIVIATHYDADHIAGLIPLMKEYGGKVGELWAHSPPKEFESFVEAYKSTDRSGLLTFSAFMAKERIDEALNAEGVDEQSLRDKASFMIESLGQLRSLEKLHPQGPKQVFAGYEVPDWPEIKVLGPTKPYYESLFGGDNKMMELIMEEVQQDAAHQPLTEDMARMQMLAFHNADPCARVKQNGKISMTATNLASLIFAIDAPKGRYLFTGDAGVESFERINQWQTELKHLYWLKVPHHGSDNNITRSLIDLMSPMYADSTGDKYQDDHVLGCIGKNVRSKRDPRSTKSSGDLEVTIQ
jgi:beta-lactamase superfamily II metal-dependent hydrolase